MPYTVGKECAHAVSEWKRQHHCYFENWYKWSWKLLVTGCLPWIWLANSKFWSSVIHSWTANPEIHCTATTWSWRLLSYTMASRPRRVTHNTWHLTVVIFSGKALQTTVPVCCEHLVAAYPHNQKWKSRVWVCKLLWRCTCSRGSQFDSFWPQPLWYH